MNENSYYRALAVSDRLYDAYLLRGKSLASLGLKGGWKASQLYRYFSGLDFPKLDTLTALAKTLNVSVCWLLDGGQKRPYQNTNISFDKIVNDKPKNKSIPPQQRVIISRIRHGKQANVSLTTAFDFEELFGISADKLFVKEQGE